MWHPFHSGWTKSITLSSHHGSLPSYQTLGNMLWERTGCMMETWAMETHEGWGSSLCPCVSSLHPLFFLAPINTFRRLLRRRHKSKTSLTLLNSLTWAMLRYASLNFSTTNTKLLWQGGCPISLQFYQTWSFVLLKLFCDHFSLLSIRELQHI